MTRSARIVALAALALSASLHLALAAMLAETEATDPAPGGEQRAVAATSLGNSFRDMQVGSAHPVETPRIPAARAPDMERAAKVTPSQATGGPRTISAQPVPSRRIAQVPAHAPVLPVAAPRTETGTAEPARAEPVSPVTPLAARLPLSDARQPIPARPADAAPVLSRRPELPARARPVAETPARGAETEERAGARATAPASSSPTPQPAPVNTVGTASEDRFLARVYRQIARARPPMGDPAVAHVEITVDPRGRLAALGMLQSSGNPETDQAILAMIRRATPFPRPPDGQTRRLKLTVELD